MGYRPLTLTQRYQIHARHGLGMSQRQIVRELGVHSSTISRELRRNATASASHATVIEGFTQQQSATVSLVLWPPSSTRMDPLQDQGKRMKNRSTTGVVALYQ